MRCRWRNTVEKTPGIGKELIGWKNTGNRARLMMETQDRYGERGDWEGTREAGRKTEHWEQDRNYKTQTKLNLNNRFMTVSHVFYLIVLTKCFLCDQNRNIIVTIQNRKWNLNKCKVSTHRWFAEPHCQHLFWGIGLIS